MPFASGTFCNFPVEHDLDDYSRAIEFIVSKWMDLETRPLSILQIGEISAPGISDIDLVLVFDNEAQLNWNEYVPAAFPEWIRKLLTHAPFCCTLDAWEKINSWFPAFNYRHLCGKKLEQPSLALDSGNALSFLIDYTISKTPVDFIRFSVEEAISVRDLLLVLNSNKYIAALADTAGIRVPQFSRNVAESTTELRNGWFTRSEQENLMLLNESFDDNISSNAGIIESCRDELASVFDSTGLADFSFTDGYWNFDFVRDWRMEIAHPKTHRSFIDPHSTPRWFIPIEYAAVLAVFADECPAFRTHFQLPPCSNALADSKWGDGLREHARGMLSYAVSSTRLGIPVQKYLAYALYYEPSIPRRIAKKSRNLAAWVRKRWHA